MKTSVILLGSLFSCAVFAQEGNAPENGYRTGVQESQGTEVIVNSWSWKKATKIFKVNPFELMSAVPTLAVDFEMKMPTPFVSLQGGVGLVPDYLQIISGANENQFQQMNGYVLRAEPRFFIFNGKHHYLSAELSFRHLMIKDQVAVGMERSEGDFGQVTYAYFINADMFFHRFNTRLTWKYGMQHIFKNGFVLEGYTGISFRKTNVFSNSDYPSGGEPQGSWNMFEWNLTDGFSRQYFCPVMGIKLGFAVRR